MVIKEIQDRIKNNYTEEELKEHSKFFLAKYTKHNDKVELSEVMPIDNNIDSFELEEGLVITDANGKILIDSHSCDKSILVQAVSNNRLLVIYRDVIYNEKEKEYYNNSAIFYEYDGGKLKAIETISDKQSRFDIKVIKSDDDYPILIINELNNGKKTSYLYSMKTNKRISPIVTSIAVISAGEKLLRYTDTIKSSLRYNDEEIENTIIGFMNIDGTLKNNVFDSRINDIRNVELNTHPAFMQYRALKNAISRELDEEVEQRIEKHHLRDAAIKRLELQAKHNK